MKANQNEKTLVFDDMKSFKAFLSTVKFMPTAFNRKVKKGHANNMKESVIKVGVRRAVTLVYTNVFNEDGSYDYYVADGQHLVTAILNTPVSKLRGLKICDAVRMETIREIIGFVSLMNSTAKNWALDNYLDAWVTEGNEGYKYIKDIKTEKKFGLSGLVEAFTNVIDTDPFKKGDFVPNKKIGDAVIKLYESAVKVGLRDTTSSFNAVVRWNINNKVNKTTFLKGIKQNPFDFGRKFGRDAYITLFKVNCK